MKLLFKLIFIFLLLGFGQEYLSSNKVDSLINLYKNTKNDTLKIKLAIKISRQVERNGNPADSSDLHYLHEAYLNSKLSSFPKLKLALCQALADAYNRFSDFDNALRYYKEAVAVASKQNDNEKVARLLFSLSQVYDVQRKHEDAKLIVQQALKLVENGKNKKLIASLYNGMAAQDMQMGKSEMAIKYFYKSLAAFEEIKDTSQIINLYKNISLAYESMGDYGRSKQLLYRGVDMAIKYKNTYRLSSLYGALGALYQNLRQYDSALYFNNKQVANFPPDIDPDSKAIAYGNLGVIYQARKDYKLSKEYYEKALAIFKSTNSYRLITISYINIAELCNYSNDHKKALYYFDEATKQSAGSDELDIQAAIHEGKYEAYLGMKDYKNALEEYRRSKVLKDSLKSAQSLTKIMRMENEYEVGKKQKENELLKAQNEVKQTLINVSKENEKNAKLLLYVSLLVLVVIVALAFQLYKGLKANKEKNRIISEQKHLVDEKNKDITDSINYAKKIQEAILPPKELKYRIYENAFVFCKPRDIVSGDFYWYTEKNNKRIIAAIDCTGHGVPGAFMSMIGNTFLTEIVEGKGITDPASILSEMRHLVIKALKQTDDATESKDGMDMALLCFDDKNRTVEYAGANNPMWMMLNGECVEFKADSRPIGYYRIKGLPFTNHKIDYQKGDTFYIFTDGYADQFGGAKGKKLKYKPFKEILLSVQNEPMLKQEEILDQKFEEWKGTLDQIDDVLIIGVRV